MHTFSAFWLRSSVVSVLISLISDTDLIEIEDIKLIFDVARIASGLPVLSVTGCLCIAVSQSTADPARGFIQRKKTLRRPGLYPVIRIMCAASIKALAIATCFELLAVATQARYTHNPRPGL